MIAGLTRVILSPSMRMSATGKVILGSDGVEFEWNVRTWPPRIRSDVGFDGAEARASRGASAAAPGRMV